MKKPLTPEATPQPAAPKPPMSVQQLLDFLNKTPASQRQIEESKLQIVVLQPGSIGGTPVVGIEQAHFGFDWDARKLLLYPLQPLTRLAPEDVAAIHKSAKEGQSWHAFQQYTKQADKIKALEAEIAALKFIVNNLTKHDGPEIAALRKDAERLDWIERENLEDFSIGFVVDAPHDGEYRVDTTYTTAYGITLRSAIDNAAMQAQASGGAK